MNKINMTTLDSSASMMVNALRNRTSNADRAATEFFSKANQNDAQSQALIAYWTQVRKVKDTSGAACCDAIENLASKNKELDKEVKTFAETLNQKYPRTLNDRIALARHGSVVSDKVKPQNFWTKTIVSTRKFLSGLYEALTK